MQILFVASRYPWPVRRGDQLRAAQFVSGLATDHRVVLLAPATDAAAPPPRELVAAGLEIETYRRRLADRAGGLATMPLSGAPLQSAFFRSADLRRQIRRLTRSIDLAIVQLVRLERHLEDLSSIPVVCDLIDSLSLSFERRAQRDHRWLRGLWRHEAGRLLRSERRVLSRASSACVVCERDRRHLERRLGGELTQQLQVVPLAMTAADSAPASDPPPRPETVVLSGNLGYFPNRRAARTLLREVWPELRARRPQSRFVLAGDRPPRALVRMARRSGAQLVAAPSDLPTLLAGAAVSLAPVDSGAGFPVKVLEAWQAGIPVVASPWAAEGAGASDGVELLVAGESRQWVDRIEAILEDGGLATRLREGGRRRAQEQHSTAALSASLERLLATAVKA